MDKNIKRAIIGFTLSTLGVVAPIVPTDIPITVDNATFDRTISQRAYETETGFIGPNQYAVDPDGGYIVGDEYGYPTNVPILGRIHTEEVKYDGKSVYVNVYIDNTTNEKKVVVTHDEDNQRKLERNEIKKPQVTEHKSVIELVTEPKVAEAVTAVLPESYSFSQSSSAVQTVTFAHTNASADAMVLISGVRDNGGDIPIQVTYNGVDFTEYKNFASSTFNASAWYLVAPTTGTNNVFVDFAASTGTADNHQVTAISIDNLDTAMVFNASTTASGLGTSTATINHLAGSYGLGIRVSNDSSLVGDEPSYYDTVLNNFDSGAFTLWNTETYLRYASSTLNIGGEELTPTGVIWSSDGKHIYVVGSNTDTVYQYDCTIAYVATDANCPYSGKSLNVTTEDTAPTGIAWLGSANNILVMTGSGSDLLHQYNCSTPMDLSSCTDPGISTSTIPFETVPSDVWCNDAADRCFMVGTTLDNAASFTLSSTTDISSLAFVATTSIGSNPNGISLSQDGQFMKIMRPATEASQYRMSTYYDISTTAKVKQLLPLSFLSIMTSSGASGLFCKDASQCHIIDNTSNTIYTYEANLTATTTTSGLKTPSQNGDYIYLGVMISPASGTPPATSTAYTTKRYWEED